MNPHGIRKSSLCLIITILEITSSKTILTQTDLFIGAPSGQMFQKMVDDVGHEWKRRVRHTNLELLYNDDIVTLDEGSCRDEGRTCWKKDEANEVRKNKTKMFHENAQTVGFSHEHRNKRPARGTCNFDMVVYSRFHQDVANLKNELCTMEMLTGGAAVADYDGDGFQDIFFTVYEERSRLYRNKGDGTFEDVTEYANVGPNLYGNGAGWVDVDADGDLDLYVTTVGDTRYYLYINHGGHFSEEAVERNVSMQHVRNGQKLSGMTPSFGDFDNDGYVDMYVSEWIYHYATSGKPSASRLFRNMGAAKPGHFEDVTDSAGVNMDGYWKTFRNRMGSGTHTFGASFTDFDNDGWLDLYVTGDFGQSKMFWNNRNGTFHECTIECGIHGRNDAMGLSIADINNDGLMDIFVTAIYYTNSSCKLFSCKFGPVGNAFYLNKGNRTFVDITDQIGVRNGHWGWGSAFLDFDNDGYLDLVSTNGMDGASTTLDDEYGWDNVQLFHNQGPGHNNRMQDTALKNGMEFYGFGRGLVVFDYDNDGDEDVVVAANVGRAQFFENKNDNKNHWLTIDAMHKCPNNRSKLCHSLGARVSIIKSDGSQQTSFIGSKSQFLGQSENCAHFGLGRYKGTVRIQVLWPSTGKQMIIKRVTLDQFIKVIEPEHQLEEINYTELNVCPRLYIDSISVQPTSGEVKINRDRTSVSYLPGRLSFFDLDIQDFEYVVKALPPSGVSSRDTRRERAQIDFRVTPNSFLYPKCAGGRQIGRKNRLVTMDRRFDGKSNNLKQPFWGAAQENLINISPLAYGDNVSDPSSSCTSHERIKKKCPFPTELGGVGSHRPSPRVISNTLMAQTDDVFSMRNISDFTSHFGQFLSHDTDHTSELPRYEFQYHHNHVWMPINIPKGDVHFDPYSTGKEKMAFIRSEFNRCTSGYPSRVERKQENKITAYIDANMVYGISPKRCANLRSFKNGDLRIGENGMLIKNSDYLPNGNPTAQPSRKLFIAGDVRSNTQPGLVMLHTLFVREHNRLARQYHAQNPTATDDEIFMKARRLLISSFQYITYNEYLPAILGGKHHIPPYKGYNNKVDVSVTTEFATAAFRFGHSQVNRLIFRLEENGQPTDYGHALLREMYFKPNRVEEEGGVDPLFRGSIGFPAQEVDLLMVDEMRNHLFPTKLPNDKKNTGFDLASLNIQRGRDHGLADLNSVRKHLGLKAYKSFDQITSKRDIADKLMDLYSTPDNIDLWVGGLAEDHVPNSELGPTFHALIVEQFTRLRDGDRFWYQHNLTKEEIKMVESLPLGKIIRLNTGFKSCPDNVFFSSRRCSGVTNNKCVPIPCKECEMTAEKEKLSKDIIQQKTIVRWLTISLVVLAAVCIFLLIGVVLIRNGINKKAGYIVSRMGLHTDPHIREYCDEREFSLEGITSKNALRPEKKRGNHDERLCCGVWPTLRHDGSE